VHPTVSLGRVAGIEIGVDWSWALVFGLITWSLAATVFPDSDPGFSAGVYAAMGVVAALLFFASLLLHELGHALQARREGVEIEGITLWLFGGVARLKSGMPSAGAELRIAAAGPLVTAFLGGAVVLVAEVANVPRPLDGAVAWLGYVNLLLLAFNLLPAFPLDGGRLLHAALWATRRDSSWATRVAAGIGRGFGYLMIAGGLVLFFDQGQIGAAWLAIVGWFLLGAAGSEARLAAVRDALAGLEVRDLMIREPVTADPEETLAAFMASPAGAARFTAYPVVRDGEVVGVLPLRRVLELPSSEWEGRRVGDSTLATGLVPVLAQDEDALEALAALRAGRLHRGLVLEDGRLAGFLSITDFDRLLVAPDARRH
jgi:Zn-dependent protease/CBS domain-containing protein